MKTVRVAVKDTTLGASLVWLITPVSSISGKTPPCRCRNQATGPSFCYGLQELGAKTCQTPRLPLPITSLYKPLVETSRLTLLSLIVVVVLRTHSFEEGNSRTSAVVRKLQSGSCTPPGTTAPAAVLAEQPWRLAPFVFTTKLPRSNCHFAYAASIFTRLLSISVLRI